MSYNYIFQKMLFLGYFIIKKELQTSVHSPLSAIAIPISVPALFQLPASGQYSQRYPFLLVRPDSGIFHFMLFPLKYSIISILSL